jgi:hypothetical protein
MEPSPIAQPNEIKDLVEVSCEDLSKALNLPLELF